MPRKREKRLRTLSDLMLERMYSTVTLRICSNHVVLRPWPTLPNTEGQALHITQPSVPSLSPHASILWTTPLPAIYLEIHQNKRCTSQKERVFSLQTKSWWTLCEGPNSTDFQLGRPLRLLQLLNAAISVWNQLQTVWKQVWLCFEKLYLQKQTGPCSSFLPTGSN